MFIIKLWFCESEASPTATSFRLAKLAIFEKSAITNFTDFGHKITC